MSATAAGHHSHTERLAHHLQAGSVEPVIGVRFTLDRAIDAVQLMENGDTIGKTAIVVNPGEAN